MDIKSEKTRARIQAKQRRAAAHDLAAGPELVRHFPAQDFRRKTIAGFWPIQGEINVIPLIAALRELGSVIVLPVTQRKGHPLKFQEWMPGSAMARGAYGEKVPKAGLEMDPDVILLPLLAFTATGDRLGYGGGYYDRTLAKLRSVNEVFACGVAYAAQEAASLPTNDYDQPLDGILTETGYRTFT